LNSSIRMKKKKRYIGEGQKWFVDFLPKEVFLSLTEEERVNYQGYRNYQRHIGDSNLKISNYQKEIEKLTNLIKEEQFKIKGDFENEGWEMNVKMFYDKITHIDKNFQLNCSIEIRDRTSISKKFKDGEVKTFKNVPVIKSQYKEKDLERVYKIYGRVENSVHRKPIYFGDEIKVRKVISQIYQEDWTTEPYEYLKDEMRILISQYSRYQIFHHKWEGFKSETHNLKSISDWCTWCTKNGVDRYEWGGKK
jgi:hypothetical protein